MTGIPVTIIGGYLGAGKTTLVNHMLRHANGLRLAVLVNEFGELPIDEDLIEAQDDDIISIAGGCICCSFGSDLTAAMVDLSKLPDPPDHILIESSGVAIPGAIALTLQLVPGFVSDGIVILTDAETVQDRARDTYLGDTITRQLANADIVALNKADLVSEADLTRTHTWLQDLAPNAEILPTQRAQLALDAVLGCAPSRVVEDLGSHADALFDRMHRNNVCVDHPEALARALAEGPYGVVRAKGFLRSAKGETHLLHVVGRRWEVTPAPDAASNGIVCIGPKGAMDQTAIAGVFDNLQSA